MNADQQADSKMQPFIVGVRFTKVGKIYHFDASAIPDLRHGEPVIVETARGRQMGQVAEIITSPGTPPEGVWKPVERRATPRDLLMRQSWQNREAEVLISARNRASELRLSGMKIISAEYSYDGSRLSIFFNTESEEKIDLKSLRSDMQKLYAPAQVDLRQIGPRDVAKLLGGMGACGMETRCCAKFLTEFSSISIRMAKEQGISLTPTEITGMCGRLRCCLIYEYEQYVAARAQLPKRNKRVITPVGEGRVVDVSPLREMVLVELPENGMREFHKDELKPADEYEAFVQKAQGGCEKSESGECDCGHGGGTKQPGN
ncbi:MAG TPA: regulatory iron-sulfur-containing complex subunit RicT [Anaerolineaceae bacterium]